MGNHTMKCEICGADSWDTSIIRGQRKYGSRRKIEICSECEDVIDTLVAIRNPAVIAEIKKMRGIDVVAEENN